MKFIRRPHNVNNDYSYFVAFFFCSIYFNVLIITRILIYIDMLTHNKTFVPSTVGRVIWKKIVCLFVARSKVKGQKKHFLQKHQNLDFHAEGRFNGGRPSGATRPRGVGGGYPPPALENLVTAFSDFGRKYPKIFSHFGRKCLKFSPILGENVSNFLQFLGENILKFSPISGENVSNFLWFLGENTLKFSSILGENVSNFLWFLGDNILKCYPNLVGNISQSFIRFSEKKILKFLRLLGENALKLSPILRENTSQAFSDVASKYLSNFLQFWG